MREFISSRRNNTSRRKTRIAPSIGPGGAEEAPADMKTIEEPPYLTVGTDVSAKYRGAFCEAKIKTAKRLVKAKVTFKLNSSTAEVHDEHIRGLLKVGAIVEVRNQDGTYQEATINKLTDASLYTVVFNDGDEKTLRRSSLCLKGARHFAESETLDRLPLTNPEHFGTPVVRKKSHPSRRSNPVQEEESLSSSSEDEDADQRLSDELLGKVVCVEVVTTGDRKKTAMWYPALVVSPDCSEEVTMKKDTVLVRSFRDGKFNTVLRKDTREMDIESAARPDASLKPALEAALDFQHRGSVPSVWRTEVKDESSSSEEEDDADEEEEQEEASREEEQEEVEPFPEERENFLQQLYKFMEDRGTPINKKPVLGYRNLNLFKLFRLVHKLGGFDNIDTGSVWKQVYQDLGIPVLNSAAGYNVKCAYRKYLYGFEEYCSSTGITFHMDLPQKLDKGVELKGHTPVPITHGQELNNSEEGLVIPAETSAGSDHAPIAMEEKSTEQVHWETINSKDKEEEEVEDGKEEKGPHAVCPSQDEEKASPSKMENIKPESAEDQENKDKSGGDRSEEGQTGEECECYPPGMKVQVRYGRGRSLKTYEATVKESELEGGEVLYLVHYCGWNIRYDEWVKADKIVRPTFKSAEKTKHWKKSKSKSERERDYVEMDRLDVSPFKTNCVLRSGKPFTDFPGLTRLDNGGDRTATEVPNKFTKITSFPNNLHVASESSADEHEQEDERCPPGSSPLSRHWNGLPAEDSVWTEDVRKKKNHIRKTEWLANGPPKRREERTAGRSVDGAPVSHSNSSEDEGEDLDNKAKVPPTRKYNGLKEKMKSARPAGFWESPEKRPKLALGTEERVPGSRTKGQKDVWSSIQAQWPKKTLKELFSDSDTEAANSPPSALQPPEEPTSPVLQEDKELPEDLNYTDEKPEQERTQEFPSSGSNSVLNTPPTTPESAGGTPDAPERTRTPSPILTPQPPADARTPAAPPSFPSSPCPVAQEESKAGRSETDSSTLEVESVGGELQELPQEAEGGASPVVGSDSSSQMEREQDRPGASPALPSSIKRQSDPPTGGWSKKHKRSHKGPSGHPRKSRKAAHSSDSEDQSTHEGTNLPKSPAHKANTAALKLSHRCHKHAELEQQRNHSPRVYKWSFQMSDLEKLNSLERIAFLQEKLQDIRNHYLSLKSEVASIDRRRKRLKKKEREGTAAASPSSSSSSPSSSLTAAVMLTLAEAHVPGSSQSSGMSVECR